MITASVMKELKSDKYEISVSCLMVIKFQNRTKMTEAKFSPEGSLQRNKIKPIKIE